MTIYPVSADIDYDDDGATVGPLATYDFVIIGVDEDPPGWDLDDEYLDYEEDYGYFGEYYGDDEEDCD